MDDSRVANHATTVTKVVTDKARPVTRESDLGFVRERDHHSKDIEFRALQLTIAKMALVVIGAVAVVSLWWGVYAKNDMVFQFGSGVITTMFGMSLSFLFPRH